MRILKRNNSAVSNVVGYMFSFVVTIMVMVSAVYVTDSIIDNKTNQVAEIEAENIANYIANVIVEAVNMRAAMPDSTYSKVLDLPSTIAGKEYYIEIRGSDVYVRTLDGGVTKSASTYVSERVDSGISPSIAYSSADKIAITYHEVDWEKNFDLGKVIK